MSEGALAVDEFAMIRRLTDRKSGALAARSDIVVGIGDDAAVVAPTPGKQMALTCDTMVEIVDFLPWTMDDESIGWKAMAQNVSDLAAMGAEPRYGLVALSAPREVPPERLERLYAGLYACAERYGVAVIGGDMSTAPERISVTVTAVGEVEAGRALLRSGACAGDAVFVTGPLGLSAAGLDWLLRREEPQPRWAPLIAAHQRPQPQPTAGRALVGLASALNDVSDGLASEAWEIAEASGVRVQLHEAALPVAPVLREYAAEVERDPLEFVLGGGEDYALVGTAPASRADELLQALRHAGAAPAIVGLVMEGTPGVELLRADGSIETVKKRGYNHFGTKS